MTTRILIGDCRDVLRTLPDESVHCAVTSPPYWGLRDYGIPPSVWDGDPACDHEWGDHIRKTDGSGFQGKNSLRIGRSNVKAQEKVREAGSFCTNCGAWLGCLGLEPDYQMFVEHMVQVFAEVRRVLRHDGTLWLNLGDSYATGAGRVGERPGGGARGDRWTGAMGKHGYVGNSIPVGPMSQPNRMPQHGLKPKDLVGAPWRVAFALQADGWWLRQDIIWHKPNPMPESVTDRCTKAHEYLFLLSKSERYYFDQAAIKEEASANTNARLPNNGYKTPDGWDTSKGDGGHGSFHKEGREAGQTGYSHKRKTADAGSGIKNNTSMDAALAVMPAERIKRSVWTVPTQPFPEAHFATFPPALIEPCILAGCPEGGTVLDPFGGGCTTGLVAERLKRDAILIELNPEYAAMAKARIAGDCPMFTEVA